MFIQASATDIPFPSCFFDLVMCSPPYMDARTYGIYADRNQEEWIDWMLKVVCECVRVSRGPVIINCGGVTRDHAYWPGCEGLLYRACKELTGVTSCRPAFWHRVGIPGSGGKYWLRADIEYCLCFKRPGPLPQFDVSAIGHAPKWAPGGAMSHMLSNGKRVNQWGASPTSTGGGRRKNGNKKDAGLQPSHEIVTVETKDTSFSPPVYANPGVRIDDDPSTDEIISMLINENRELKNRLGKFDESILRDDINPGDVLEITVGGGHMGNDLAHENEAAYPERLPEFFIKGWTKPGDKVFDPFSGSGTTVATAQRLGRIGIGADLRMSQCKLGQRRLDGNPLEMFL